MSHWFDVTYGQYIQGIIAQYKDEKRVYAVTVTPPMINSVHDRWLSIINNP